MNRLLAPCRSLLLLPPLLLLLGSTPLWAADKSTFSAYGNYSSSPASLTLSAQLTPASADLGASGSVWLAAVTGGSTLLLTPSGWSVYQSGPLTPYYSGPLASLKLPVVTAADVSGAECAQLLAGYGVGSGDKASADMLGNSTYSVVYQVPAARSRSGILPCSTSADADYLRLLEQATFGPTDSDLATLRSLGSKAWIEQQLNTPATGYGSWSYYPTGTPPSSCDAVCQRDNYTRLKLQRQFFQNALTGSDQLRQRVAFALQQILVISGNTISLAYGNAGYQQLLLDHAFDNFETLLTAATLNPAMGDYLDMVNNSKPTTSTQQANENYARELMQLFSVGLYLLNADGSVQTDSSGRALASYDETVIKNVALALTGWTYPPLAGATSRWGNPVNYSGQMVAFDNYHDTSSKTVLGGSVLAAGQSAQKDLTDVIHAIFMHPNVGPFIGKQLIQKLVTSNPSPAYVARITAVFNDNGQGVRGDLKAVVKAILLDSEARGGLRGETAYGHLKEPVLYVTQLLRALGGSSDGIWLQTQTSSMGEDVFQPTTVFNFYPPDYTLPNGYLGPEFGIYNANTAFARSNFAYQLFYNGGARADSTVSGSIGTTLDLTPYVTLAAQPDQLVDRLDRLLTHGTLSPTARQALISALTAVSDNTTRAKLALYLFATSSQFQVAL